MEIKIKPKISYKGNGTQKSFTFPFDYLRKSFVNATVNKEKTTAFTINGKELTFSTAPSLDADIVIYRSTDTERLVSWADASVLHAKDMTIQQVQELHILEEQQQYMEDNSLLMDEDNTYFDARGLQVKNVANGTDPKDAVNKEQLDVVDAKYEKQLKETADTREATEQAKIDAQNAAEFAQQNKQDAEQSAKKAEDIAKEISTDKFIQQNGNDKFVVYNDFASLGLDYTKATILDIIHAMPNHSIFTATIDSNTKGFYYLYYGILTVVKNEIYRCSAHITNSTSKKEYVGYCYALQEDLSDETWSGWSDISSKGDLRPRNNPIACNQLIECAETYLNKRFIYGHNNDDGSITGPTDYQENVSGEMVNKIDCATFVKMVLEGIPYHKSKFASASNKWRNQNNYNWAYQVPYNWEKFCAWGYIQNWEIDPGINYSNLQAGDLVFWKLDEKKVDRPAWATENFRQISHVGIFTGRWVPDPARNNELHPQTIEVQYVGVPANNVVTYRFIDDGDDKGYVTDHHKDNLVMFVRVPLRLEGAVVLGNGVTSATKYTYYHKADLEIKGNGQDIIIDVSTRNLADYNAFSIGTINAQGVDSDYNLRARSGFIPYSKDLTHTTILPSGFVVNSDPYYYKKDKSFDGFSATSPTAAYVRYVFKKTDNSIVTEADLNTLRNGYIRKVSPAPSNYERGISNSIVIAADKMPNGYTCKRINGYYCISNDGYNWVPSSQHDKLDSIYLYDGENNIRILNGQNVEII